MGDNVHVVEEGGVSVRPRAEAEALGLPVEHPGRAEARTFEAQRRKMFDTAAHKATTFAEAVVDTFMAGFVHETGEEADIRRDVNAPYAFAGEAVGTVGALLTGVGPAARIMKTGERVGRVAAQSVLRQGEKSIATAAAGEAGAAMAQVGAMTFGHQVLDTLIEDRPFSSEAIADNIGLAGVLGLVGGGLMGGLSKAGTRAEIRAQGGLIAGEGVTPHVQRAMSAYDEAFDFHAQQLGAMKELRRVGRLDDVSDDFIRVRETALREADSARRNLRELDLDDALSGRDPQAYARLQKDAGRYFAAMDEVESLMRPAPVERAVEAGEMYPAAAPEVGPIEPLPSPSPVAAGHQAIGADMHTNWGSVKARNANFDEVLPPSQGRTEAPGAAGSPWGGGDVPRGQLDALNALVDSLPLPASGAQQARQAHRLIMEPPPPTTVVEAVPAGKLAGMEAKALDGAGTAVRPRPPKPDKWTRAEVANHFMDEWFNAAPERIRPWDEAQSKATAAMQELYLKSGGRYDSARALGLLERDGLLSSTHPLGASMDQVYSMNRTAHLASLESKGIPTTLRDAAEELIGGALGAKIARAALGGALGGPLGMALGFTKFGGKLAAASGRLAMQVAESVGKFMTSTKVRAIAVPASNRPWQYSEKGPIADPVERIQEIQFLAANPDAIRQMVLRSSGDLAVAAPDMSRAVQEVAIQKLRLLAMRAPAIYWDKLGRPLSPPVGKLREFFEYENAAHDLPSLLKTLAAGHLTRAQTHALAEQWPAVHVRITQGMLSDPEALRKLSRAHLRTVEAVTGMALTGAADPMFLVRQQQAWQPTAPPTPPGKPQAFNINPDGAPTPSQAGATGRAPGN